MIKCDMMAIGILLFFTFYVYISNGFVNLDFNTNNLNSTIVAGKQINSDRKLCAISESFDIFTIHVIFHISLFPQIQQQPFKSQSSILNITIKIVKTPWLIWMCNTCSSTNPCRFSDKWQCWICDFEFSSKLNWW